jgi:hypothetical protein
MGNHIKYGKKDERKFEFTRVITTLIIIGILLTSIVFGFTIPFDIYAGLLIFDILGMLLIYFLVDLQVFRNMLLADKSLVKNTIQIIMSKDIVRYSLSIIMITFLLSFQYQYLAIIEFLGTGLFVLMKYKLQRYFNVNEVK